MREFWSTLCTSVKQIKAPYLFDWNKELLFMQCRGIGPNLSAGGKSDGFSRVAVGSGGMFSSYGGGSKKKLLFLQRRQDSYLVTMDNSGI